MPAGPERQSSSRRTLVIYLVAVVGPALVLLYLGLESIRRQQQAIRALALSNLQMSAERLEAELEGRTSQLAERCLRDAQWQGFGPIAQSAKTPEGARKVRNLLAQIKGRHPIAGHLFVIQGNAVLFPMLYPPPPRPVESELAREAPAAAQQFKAGFAEAEERELREQRPEIALAAYGRCYDLPVSNSLKALALSRVARCLQKLNRRKPLDQAYRTLVEKYGDLYDPSYRPYALVAGLELDGPELLSRLYSDLAQGRWELSAEQAEYFLARFQERGKSFPAVESEYLASFKLARSLEEGFRQTRPIRPGEVFDYAFTHGETSYQTFYRLLSDGGQPAILGLAVDLGWVKSYLLPQSRSALGIDPRLEAGLLPARRAKQGGPIRTGLAVFRAVYPFWELSLATPGGAEWQTEARPNTLVFAGTTALVLAVLVLGVVLLRRDVSRETELNRLRTDFVSGVSHELKTPLTLIRLYGETLLEGDSFTEQERRSYYQIITRESERLSDLIEKVLDFSRIERGQKQYHFEEGDLGPVIAGTVEVYGEYLKRRGFQVETSLASSLPPVRFDAGAVSQAVLNLLENAMKYSGDSRFVGVRLRSEGNRVIFEVEDRGIGIPAGEESRIFEQFYRGHEEAGKGGYGLGLFLVKHIMDAHEGQVEIESQSGRGSLFRLIFPAQERRA